MAAASWPRGRQPKMSKYGMQQFREYSEQSSDEEIIEISPKRASFKNIAQINLFFVIIILKITFSWNGWQKKSQKVERA